MKSEKKMFEELEAVSKRLKKFERLEKEIENSRDVWKKAKYMNALAVLYELEISDISEEINAPENQDKGKENALASIAGIMAGIMIIEKRKELQQEMDKLAEIMTSDLERRLPELNLSENLEKLAERELEKLRELKEKEKKEKNFQ